MPVYCWHCLISLTLQLAAVAFYASINTIAADASPLLEEEQRSLFLGLLFYRQHPRFFHRSCVDCMFSANDYQSIFVKSSSPKSSTSGSHDRNFIDAGRLRRLSILCFTSLASTDTPSQTFAGIARAVKYSAIRSARFVRI